MTHPTDSPPGRVVLFGSGETSPSGSKIYQSLAPHLPRPLRLAVLETPAGFELNSAQVAGRVAEFLASRLQNDKPEVAVVPARKRGTAFSPEDATVIAPLREASLIFMGAGSPTYTVRQLQASLAWHTLQAAHRQGATVVLASATVLAASAVTLPVYEIYKVGEDPHWHSGLDFLAPFGLPLVFVPHWNNAEGGADLDTSRCFMGQARFAELTKLLPPGLPVIGIDEHTALVLDLTAERCEVLGTGNVTMIKGGTETRFASRAAFALSELGPYHPLAANADLPAAVWEDVRLARRAEAGSPAAPEEVTALVAQREAARRVKDWPRADAARVQLAALGWQIKDTPTGPVVERTQTGARAP